jgi:hypothetical protein
MSNGFVGAQSWPAGIQWFAGFASHLMFGLHGEPIGANDGAKMAWVLASRCPECRVIVAEY